MSRLNGLNTRRMLTHMVVTAMTLGTLGCSALITDAPIQNQQVSFDGYFEGYDGCAQPPPDKIRQLCQSKHGTMQRKGMKGCYMCVVTYQDAGKSCQDASDCLGDCKAKQGTFLPVGASNQTGQCASNNSPFGCYQTIEKGIAQSALCVD